MTFGSGFAVAQGQMMADTDGKDAPLYFADAEEVIAEMASTAEGPSLPVKKDVEVERAKA